MLLYDSFTITLRYGVKLPFSQFASVGTKSYISHNQNAKTKSLMCQNDLFTICLSLVHEVLDMSKSTSTYCWSHLFINSGNLVAHLIIFVSMLPLKSLSPLLTTDPPLAYIFFHVLEKFNIVNFKIS